MIADRMIGSRPTRPLFIGTNKTLGLTFQSENASGSPNRCLARRKRGRPSKFQHISQEPDDAVREWKECCAEDGSPFSLASLSRSCGPQRVIEKEVTAVLIWPRYRWSPG